jgi:hypothetical protein
MIWVHHVKDFVWNSGKIKFQIHKNTRRDKKDVVGVRYGLVPMKFAAHAVK